MFVKLYGTGALYQQLYQSLRSAILAGQLAPGTRLPATRTMARELGVSRNTVLLAYEQLLAEGYAVGQTGSGTYVASSLPDAMLTTAAVPDAIESTPLEAAPRLSAYGRHAAANSPLNPPSDPVRPSALRYDFRYGLPAVEEFPHDIWRRLLTRRARSASLRSLRYGPPEGYGPLREAIADYLRRSRAVVCDPEQIVVVNGSQQALDLTARVLLDPGDRVVIEEPHYQGARQVFLAAGAELLPGRVDAEGLDVAALPKEAAEARLAFVTPSHQYPSGAIMSLARRLALLSWAEDTDAYVLEDDYDSEYRYEGRPVEAVQGLDRNGRVIYVGTFSKVLFPALRLGYMVLPRPLVQPILAAKWLTDRHTSTLEQEMLTDFIREGHFERHLRRSRTRNAALRATLLEALDTHFGSRISISGANAGIHLLVWLHDIAPEQLDELIVAAARADVGLYPVTPYYMTPPSQAGLLLGYAAMTETDIRDGIERLAIVLRQRHQSVTASAISV
ncbi:MocR-like pyridoxine biosynthesis transcription factor PdxR [Candidatus Entotheonella palauensis]|nr:PLP-dependent aminotransferase family protein [Candidatus Entotheonella palauensis]